MPSLGGLHSSSCNAAPLICISGNMCMTLTSCSRTALHMDSTAFSEECQENIQGNAAGLDWWLWSGLLACTGRATQNACFRRIGNELGKQEGGSSMVVRSSVCNHDEKLCILSGCREKGCIVVLPQTEVVPTVSVVYHLFLKFDWREGVLISTSFLAFLM